MFRGRGVLKRCPRRGVHACAPAGAAWRGMPSDGSTAVGGKRPLEEDGPPGPAKETRSEESGTLNRECRKMLSLRWPPRGSRLPIIVGDLRLYCDPPKVVEGFKGILKALKDLPHPLTESNHTTLQQTCAHMSERFIPWRFGGTKGIELHCGMLDENRRWLVVRTQEDAPRLDAIGKFGEGMNLQLRIFPNEDDTRLNVKMEVVKEFDGVYNGEVSDYESDDED